jgi:hypothetical protein
MIADVTFRILMFSLLLMVGFQAGQALAAWAMR